MPFTRCIAVVLLLAMQAPVVRAGAGDPLPETTKPPASSATPEAPGPGFKVELSAPRLVSDTTGRARPARRPVASIVAEADSAVRARGGARADDAQLFLSWNAPWGQRGAKQALMPACNDSTVADTLYLTMLTGRTSERFTGFTAQILVHATGADTLGPWWHMESRGGANPGSMRVEWAALSPWAKVQPFRAAGQGFVILDHTTTKARLRMVFAVPYDESAPIAADSLYTLARIILRHRTVPRLPGCEKPVVIEWAEASLAFGPKDEPFVRRGERFVAFSGPFALLEPFRGVRREAWKPKPATR
jgi:hypothetical protein